MVALIATTAHPTYADVCTYSGSGAWTVVSNWSPHQPTATDSVVVAASAILSVSSSTTVASMTLSPNSVFSITGGTFAVGAFTSSPTSKLVLTAGTFSYSSVVLQGSVAAAPFTASGKVTIQLGGGIGVASTAVTIASADVTWVSTSNYYPSLTSSSTLTFATGSVVAVSAQSANTNGLVFGDTTSRVYNYGQITITSSVCQALVSFKAQVFNYGSIIYADSSNCALPYRVDYASGLSNYGLIKVDDGVQWAVWTLQSSFLNAPNATLAPGLKVTSITSSGQSFRLFGTFAPGTTAISNLVISAASAQLYPSRLGVVALIANLGGNNALTLGPCTGDPAIVPATDSQEAFALAYACYATLTSISVRSGIFPLFKYFTTAFTPSISVSSTGNLQLQDATVNMLSTFFASSGTISCASAITPPCNLNFQASTNLTLLGTFTTNSAVLTFASTTTLNLPGSMYIYTSTASSKVVLASSTTLTKNSNQSPFSGIGTVANSGNLQVVLADPAAGFRPAIAFSNTGSVTVSVAPGITASSTLDIVFSDSFSNSGGFYFADSSNAGIPLRSIQFQSGYSSTATSIISANVSSVSMNFAAAAWVNGTFFGTALHAPTGLVATSVVPLLTVTGGAAAAQFGPASMNVAELVVSGGNIVLASCDGDPLFPCMTSIRRIGVTGTSGSCQLTVANTAMAIALQPDVWTLGGACQLTFPGSYQVDGGMFITGGRVGCVSGGDCSALDVMSNSSMQLVNSFTVYGSTLKFRAPLFIDFSGTNYVYLIGLVASSQLHFYSNTSISVARTVTTRAVFSSSATQLINYGTMTVQFVGCPSGLYMSAPFVNNGIVRLLGTGASAPCATNQLYLPDYSFSNFGTLFYDASTNNGLTLGMTFYSLATDSSSVMAGRVGTLTISSSTPSAIRGAFFGTTTSDVSGPLPYISSLQQLQLQAPVSLAPTTMNAVAVTVSSSVTQLNPCGADPSDFSCYASIATVGLTGTGSGCMLNVSSTLAAASLQPANWLLGGSCTLNIPGNYTMAGSLFLNGGFLKCTSANASCIVDVLSNSTVGDTTTFQVVQSILRFRNTVQWMASSTNSYAYLLGSSSGGFTASLEFYGATTVVVSRLVNSRLVYSAYSASLLNAGDMTVLLQTCPSGLNVQVPFVNTGSIRVMSAVAGGCTSHSLVLDGYQFTNDDDGLLFLDDSTNANNPFDLTFAGGVINTAGSAMFGRVGLLTISGLSSSIEGHFFGSSLSTPLTTLPYTEHDTLTSSIAISFAPTSMQVVKLVVSASATTLRDCGGVAGASSCYASIQQVILYGSTTCSLTVASNATSTGLQPAFWSIGGSCTLNLPGSFPISGSVLLTGGTIACTFGGTCVVDIQSNSTIRLSDSSLTVTETSLRFRANVRWEIVSNSYIYLLGTRSLSELQFYSTTTVLNSRTTASRVVFSSYTAQIVNYGSLVVQLLSCPSFTYLSAPLINYGTILMQSVNLTCATHTLTQDGPVSHYGEFFFNTSSNGNLPVTINLNAGLTTWPGSVMAGDVGTMQLQGTAPYSIQGAFFGTIKSNLTGSTPYASSIASIATSASTLTWQPTTMNLAAITQTSGVAQFLPCDGVGSYVCYRSIATIAASGSASQLYVNSNMTALGDFQPSLQLTSGARLLISGSLTLTKPFLFRGATLTRMTGASMSSSILLMANGTVDLTATLVTDVPVTFADRVSILASTTNAFMYTTAQPARYIFASSSKTTVLQSIANPSTYYWYASDFTVPSYLVYGELNITYTVCGANFRAASNVLNAGRLLIQSTASGCSTPYAINFGDGVLTNLGSITVDTATVPSFSAVSVASLQSSDNSTLFANANITTLTISSSSYIGGVGPSFKVGTLDVRATTVVNSSQLAVTSISTSSTLTLSACGRLFSYACYSSWRSLLASGFGSAVSLVQELLDVAQPSITVQAGVVTLLGTNITLLRPVTLTGGALVGSTNVSAQTVVTLYAPNNVLQASATVSLQSLVVRVAGGLAWTWTTSLVQLLGASNLASLVVLETGSILINSSVTESSAVAFGNSIGASNLRPWVNLGSMTFLAAVCNAKFITSATLINSGLIQFQTASATPCVDSIVLDFRMALNNFGQIVTDKTLIPRFAPSSGMNSMILYPGSSFTGSFSDLQLTSFSDTNMIGGTLPSIDRLTSSGTLIVTSNTCPVARFVVRSTAKLILGPCSTAYFNTSSVNFTLAAETAFACYSGVTDVSVLEQSTVQLHQNLSVYLQPTWTFGSSSQATLALWGVVNMTRPVQFNGLVVTLLSGAPESATLNLLAPVTITRTMLIYDTHVAFAQPVNISMPASTQVMVAQGNLFLTGTLVHFLPSCTVQFNATLPLGSPQLFYTYVNAQILNEGTININMISCPSFFAIGSLVNSGVLSVTGNASCLQRHSVNFDSYVINTGAIRLDEVSFPVSSLLLHGYSSTNAASFRTNALTTINYAVIVQTAYPTTDSLISGVFTVGPQSTVTFSSDTVVDDVSHVQISQLIISSSFGNNSLGSCFPADSTDCWEISALTIQQSTVAYATANVLARLTNGLLLLTDATLALFEPVVTVNTNITWAGGSIKGLGGMASTLNANGPFTKLDNANMQLRDVTLVINSASATWFVRDVYALSVSTSSASLRGGVVLGSGASLAFVPGASVTVGATTVFQVLSNTAAYATVDFQNAGAIDTSALSGALALRFGVPIVNNGTLSLPGSLFVPICLNECFCNSITAATPRAACPFSVRLGCRACSSFCLSSEYLLDGSCVSSCPAPMVVDNSTCASSCSTPGALIDPITRHCYVGTCDAGEFFNAGTCTPCGAGCATCSSAASCDTCQPSDVLYAGACLDGCPPGLVEYNGACLTQCPSGLFSYNASCVSCSALGLPIYLPTSSCVETCPAQWVNNGTYCEACSAGCLVCDSATTCTQCSAPKLLYEGICYNDCPDGTYANSGSCLPCSANCALCKVSDVCDSCLPSYSRLEGGCVLECPLPYVTNGTDCVVPRCADGTYRLGTNCVIACPSGMYGDAATATCEFCISSCEVCSNGMVCDVCNPGFLHQLDGSCKDACLVYQFHFEGACYETCPAGTFLINDTICVSSCPPPTFAEGTNCILSGCAPGTYYFESDCLASCPPGTYPYDATFTCQPCSAGCAECFVGTECSDCNPGFLLESNGTCTDACTVYSYQFEGLCYESCPPDTFLIDTTTCVSSCPAGTYGNVADNTCEPCHTSCSTCDSSAFDGCTSCPPNHVLTVDHTCIAGCPPTQFASDHGCVDACDVGEFQVQTANGGICADSCNPEGVTPISCTPVCGSHQRPAGQFCLGK
ncbi:hypothetical protein CAOG_03412 [Capsaspora owczarzaki ATCC 30864]|uniref:hypothetical protein n=1 Tax=Capsaspora owczarzaki (strain ATCC 30864) TaxID=595528 RepID=UPI0003525268|nr:hypothetical protein CAOG_03412 [Capsaspora owczarzaki ATCC 30864]|eukprot:XP_004364251.2 hypothetical protein CAOG_03412 [Capsaspora owczarzaki ATCC 30864]